MEVVPMAEQVKGELIPVATNRRAQHEYFIEDSYEAGIALTGTEIKSVRARRVNLQDGFVQFRRHEAWLLNVHIAPYDFGNRENHEPRRERRLLLHRREIRKLESKVAERGWTVVPLRMYLKEGKAKLEIGLARGKRLYDKRDSVAERDMDREMERDLRRTVQDYDTD
jgi:SsrA-binding protein